MESSNKLATDTLRTFDDFKDCKNDANIIA